MQRLPNDFMAELKRNLIKEYQNRKRALREPSLEWFWGAAQRLGYWLHCIEEGGRLNSDNNVLEGDYSRHWQDMPRAVELLLDAATPRHGDEPIPAAGQFLNDLNNELLLDLSHQVHQKRDDSEIIRTLYQQLQNDPDALVAALAIFDVHMDRFIGAASGSVPRARPLELLQNVFLVIIEGLNIWALRRRWLDIYYWYQESEALREREEEYARFLQERERLGSRLIKDFQKQLGRFGAMAELYQRTTVSIYRSRLPREDLNRALFLKITCPDESFCYLAEAWVEKLGKVELRLARKSLYHPEENGTRRLQVGVRLPKSNLLIIARIGTAGTQLDNEWGKLLALKREEARGTPSIAGFNAPEEAQQAHDKITIFTTTGAAVQLDCGSTVLDYIIGQYPLEEARHILKVYVNANTASVADKLEDNCVVRVILDRNLERMLPLEEWRRGGTHRLDRTRAAIQYFEEKSRASANRGRDRILYMVQSHVAERGFTIDRNVLVTLLNASGLTVNKANEEQIFGMLATDTTRDERLCELALQYCLHEKLRTHEGYRPDFRWREVRFAEGCCTVTFGDDIVGTVDEGPRNPERWVLNYNRELRIHRNGCKKGPTKNRLPLVWSSERQRDKRRWGLRAGIVLNEDYEGSLANVLDLIQNELRLKVHYVTADGMNFGPDRAIITLFLSSGTSRERDTAMTRINDEYGQENVQFQVLEPRDSREMLMAYGCPYRTNTDPEVNKHTPLYVVGRERQLTTLKAMVNDPEQNRAMVVGYFRTGKTWLVKHFKSTFTVPGRIPLYISFDVPPAKFSPDNMIHYVYNQAWKRLSELGIGHRIGSITVRPRKWYNLTRWFEKIAEVTSYKFILLLDEFSAIAEWMSRGLVSATFPEEFVRFMDDSARYVDFVLVFQAAHFHDLIETDSEMTRWFRSRFEYPIEVAPFTNDELKELLTRPVEDQYEVTPGALDIAMTLTGGIPYMAAMLGKNIWHYSRRNDCGVVTEDVLRDIAAKEILHNLDWDAALHRLSIEKLPPAPLHLLRTMAVLQMDHGRVPPWELTNAVRESSLIQEVRRTELTLDVRKLLDGLQKARLVENSEDGKEPRWRVSCQLLAHYLTVT